MYDSLLYMSDNELEEILKSGNIRKIIDNIIKHENDDEFQLLVERIEQFDLNLAEYLQKKRKTNNYKCLFENGANPILYTDSLINKLREYALLQNDINNRYDKIIDALKKKFEQKHNISFDDFDEIINDGKYINNKPLEEYVMDKLSITKEMAKSLIRDYNQSYKEYCKLFYQQERELKKIEEKYNEFFAVLGNMFDDKTMNVLYSVFGNLTEDVNYEIVSEEKEIIDNSLGKKAVDILISDFFREAPTNFFKNINMMIDFHDKSDEQLIPLEHLHIYSAIVKLYSKPDIDEIKKLYNEMNAGNNSFIEMYYDDFSKARLASSRMLVESVFKCSGYTFQDIDGVPVYELNGEPFYMIVHASNDIIDDFSKGENEGISLSFISGDRLTVYNSGVIYGFDNLLPEQFVNIYSSDAYTKFNIFGEKHQSIAKNNPLPESVPSYTTPDVLIRKTPEYMYNEILYLTHSNKYELNIQVPKPSYIICYDKENDKSIQAAKKNNIPIVIINTKHYSNPNTHLSHFVPLMNDTYKGRKR